MMAILGPLVLCRANPGNGGQEGATQTTPQVTEVARGQGALQVAQVLLNRHAEKQEGVLVR